jgi:replicative DNA helicase
MSSVESLVVSKIIREKAIDLAVRAGLRPHHFAGEWEDIYQWIIDYYGKHTAPPTERSFSLAYGDVDLEDANQEPFSGLVEELLDAYRHRVVTGAMAQAMGPLEGDDVKQAMEVLTKALREASVDTVRIRDFNIIDTWEERYARYEEMRNTPNALRGIPTGFSGLDRITQGLRPQQFIVLAGEPKRGKSLFELIMAMACHDHGKVPMFLSFEMSVAEQESRYDALSAGIPYDRILTGQMSDLEMKRLLRMMEKRKLMQPFYMSEDTSRLTTISAVAGKIQEYQPDALFIDGLYLMDDENGEPKGSPQALTNISRGLKRLSQTFDIPVVGTTQVLAWKLRNQKTRAITGDSIGYTSSFLQDADLILGVERNPDIDDQAIIRVVEARAAANGVIHVQWNWATMEFTEIEYDDVIDPSYD